MAEDGDRVLAAVAYVLTFLTGILVYVLAKPEDKYARWHALQAIGLGIVVLVAWFVVAVVAALLAFSSIVTGSVGFGFGLLGGLLAVLFELLVLVLVLALAVKAYRGEKFRLPYLAEFADKNA